MAIRTGDSTMKPLAPTYWERHRVLSVLRHLLFIFIVLIMVLILVLILVPNLVPILVLILFLFLFPFLFLNTLLCVYIHAAQDRRALSIREFI